MEEKIIFGYWNLRGRGQTIRYLLEYLGANYEEKSYSINESESKEWYEQDKKTLDLEHPNIPYLLHGDVKISESLAIAQYLAEALDPSLLGKNLKEKATILQHIYVLYDARNILREYIMNDGIKLEDTRAKSEVYFKRFDKIAKGRKWLTGENLSLVEFFLYEISFIHIAIFGEQDFKERFPELSRIFSEFEEVPQINKFLRSPKSKKTKIVLIEK